ncbi:hypothetical protein CEUSTIGMA_g9966.t1 [Chlamydomonas eustigma]|uniref:Uncharacterized protein n=1 Tax=Chlamydomonas eustigma TaxID=1157962 RepID=A0A250XHZ5_9CHLO|nr:hypothetical protein CEUSTIGMA_g9966.t1 [Chlamydomonas eustigma]|eukprot:GAX82539.1 hypothetical protein CEUSTIGMA_g9966.t1 [Chlamydomonas eustigma]
MMNTTNQDVLRGQAAYASFVAQEREQNSHRNQTELIGTTDGAEKDVFVYFASQIMANELQSLHGLYRVRLDASGDAAQIWCYRSSTPSELSSFLSASAMASIPDAHCPTVNLHSPRPCAWNISDAGKAQMLLTSQAWGQDVWSKASLQALHDMLASSFSYTEGSSFAEGSCACPRVADVEILEKKLCQRSAEYQMGEREHLSIATEDNKVYVHWRQPLTCRSSQDKEMMEGMSLLTFDQSNKLAQVFEYTSPTMKERQTFLLGREHSCQGELGLEVSEVNALPPGIDAEALARQELEWEAW